MRLGSAPSCDLEDGGSVRTGRSRSRPATSFASGRSEPPRPRLRPDPHLKQASVISEVIGGTGQFDGARGQIVSNILVSDTGEVTDNHLGVIFVEATP